MSKLSPVDSDEDLYAVSYLMAITQPRQLSLIPDITRDTQDWTVVLQVVERHRVKVGNGTPNKPGKRYRRYMMADEQGNRVSVIVYEGDIRFFEYILKANAVVIPAVSFFKVDSTCPFSCVLDWKKLVEPLREDVTRILPFTYEVLDFTEFSKHADVEFYFDVKGVVIHVFPRKQVDEKPSHREVVIIDERKIPIILTLWNDFGDVEGLELAHLLPSISIIVARNAKATTFHGLSLSTRMYSCILINPPLPESLALRGWSHDNTNDIKKMVKYHTFRDPSVLLPPPTMEDTVTVGQGIATLRLKKAAWVIGKPKFIHGKQKLFYNACQTCKRRLDCPMEWVIECSECGEQSGVEYWSRVTIQLAEGDQSIFLTITSPDVERLTMVTPKQIRDSDEFNKQEKTEEIQSPEKMKLVAVKTYNVTELKINDHLQSPPKQLAAAEKDQKEQQFFTPTTCKVLDEIDKQSLGTESEQPKPAVKRNIDFISSEAISATAQASSVTTPDKSTSGQPLPLDVSSSQSPVNKNKEHLKQS